MDEFDIRSTAAVYVDDRREPAPEDLTAAMVRFEERYGGLFYPVIGGNGMEHGLDGDAAGHHSPLGLAFTGIVDGDWTWGVDVLTDGRTAMGPGQWPHRIIDRAVGWHETIPADWCALCSTFVAPGQTCHPAAARSSRVS